MLKQCFGTSQCLGFFSFFMGMVNLTKDLLGEFLGALVFFSVALCPMLKILKIFGLFFLTRVLASSK